MEKIKKKTIFICDLSKYFKCKELHCLKINLTLFFTHILRNETIKKIALPNYPYLLQLIYFFIIKNIE
jgi:hypothetical protein